MSKTDGMVLCVKLVSLKHRTPSDLLVVLEMYKENPRNLPAYPLGTPHQQTKAVVMMCISKISGKLTM